MTAMTLGLLGGALLMAAAGAMVFVVAARRGLFDDIEDVKYQILQEENADE